MGQFRTFASPPMPCSEGPYAPKFYHSEAAVFGRRAVAATRVAHRFCRGNSTAGQPSRQIHGSAGRHALGHLGQISEGTMALAGNPSQELRTIGITGSAGKTVTAMLVASIFEAADETAGVMSSLGHSDSVVQRAATGETPTAAEFASWLARMRTCCGRWSMC